MNPSQPSPDQYPGQGHGQQNPGPGYGRQYPGEQYPGQGYGQQYPGQQYGQAPGYGEQPFPTSGDQAATADPARPDVVRYAFWAILTAVIIGILSTALALVNIDETLDLARQEALRTAPANVDPAQLDAAVTGGVYGAIIGGVAFTLLLAFFAYKAFEGRNWARIATTVLAALNVLFGLPALFSGQGLMGLVGASTLVLQVVGAVLLWLPASNSFFAAHKRLKAARMLHNG